MDNDIKRVIFLCTLMVLLSVASGSNNGKPCAAREIFGRSVVCVCNETYCDELVRETPGQREFIAYTSSRDGSRFKKSFGHIKHVNTLNNCCAVTLELHPNEKFQTIEGFGGAITDTAGINWQNLSNVLEKSLIDSYFSEKGHQYNMLRLPIGGTDFSTHPYAYNELPKNDAKLSNFSLSYEDYHYKIPLIKAAMETSKDTIHIIASSWSPPPWMKTNNKFLGFSELKPEYFQTFADYYYKFIDKYAQEGVPLWGITTTNEPINGVIPIALFNSLGWRPSTMGQWIVNNMGPTIRNSKYKHLKIITVDDQRITIPYWFNTMVKINPKVLNYIDGVGVHSYLNFVTGPSVYQLVTELYPDKFVISTESSQGFAPWDLIKVDFGSWKRAEFYVHTIISDLNYNVIGWLDWNLCANEEGGPAWPGNFVDSQIVVFPEKGEFIKQPMYYAMGHFSKFLPRGSRRIRVEEDKSLLIPGVEQVAFLTPYNTIVVVIFNEMSIRRSIGIKVGNDIAVVEIEANSFVTVELNYKDIL